MARYLSSTQWLRWTLSYPIEEQGHSPSQWLRGILSDPIHETDRPAELPVVLNTHPKKVTPIQVAISSIPPRFGPEQSLLGPLPDFQRCTNLQGTCILPLGNLLGGLLRA